MSRLIAAGSFFVVFTLLTGGSAYSVTCEECLEISKKQNLIRQSLFKKRKELKSAFDSNNMTKFRELRTEITDFRKNLIKLKRKEDGCAEACTPEEVKRSECRKIKLKIHKLETGANSSKASLDKMDGLYRDLAKCNREWEQIR